VKFRANPWDSLMVCGFSWEEAKRLVRLYAKKENIKPRDGKPKERE